MSAVKLIGLDFGTTTSSAVVASATLAHNSVTGRQELSRLCECYRSDIIFTPFNEQGLDESRVQEYLDTWLAAADVRSEEIFGGGALLTGLAAQQQNAEVLVRLIRSRLGDALIASAGDPCLEAWLAFQASAAALSRAHPDRWIVNLDIGGGTTNLALGKNGEVSRTGCLFVGARHVQVVPGTYRIVKLSVYARRLFDHLDIARGPGDCLNHGEVNAVLDFYVNLLESAVTGSQAVFQEPVARLHQQVGFNLPADAADVIVTLSGGVGELVYGHLQRKPLPATTYFGDLGIDLAQRLLTSPYLAKHFKTHVPACSGRATVYGLLRHTTQISGSTLFLPNPAVLPLKDLPILGRITPASTDEQMRDILDLVRRSPHGGCVHILLMEAAAVAAVAALGTKISRAIKALDFPSTQPLVVMVRENLGKALGQYITEWGSLPLNLVVLDEIEIRDAQFAQIGSLHNQVVPVSFYGMN
jgi:ethanolamine utilization protein EutA